MFHLEMKHLSQLRGGVIIPEATKKGYAEAHEGDGIYINRPHQKRGVVQKGMIQTIKTSPDVGVVVKDDMKIDNNDKLKGISYNRKFGSKGKLQEVDGLCDTLVTAMGTGGGNVPIIKEQKSSFTENNKIIEYGSYYTWSDKKGNYNTQCNRASKEEGCALTIACAETGKVAIKNYNRENYNEKLRIRKLTPKECYRLMGVPDRINKNTSVSNAQQYKQAGNSIVTTCLMAIFGELLDIDYKSKIKYLVNEIAENAKK